MGDVTKSHTGKRSTPNIKESNGFYYNGVQKKSDIVSTL